MGSIFTEWRKRATSSGLLISPQDALTSGPRAHALAGISQHCGVSLDWLTKFVDVLDEEELSHLSTAEVVAKLVSVATTLRPPVHTHNHFHSAPLQTLPSHDDRPSMGTAHLSVEHETVGTPTTGPVLSKFQETLTSPTSLGASTAARQELHVRLFDIIPKPYTGRPQYYLIHAWQGNCSACLKAIIQRLKHLLGFPGACIANTGGSCSSAASVSPTQQAKLMAKTFIWIDWAALPQQPWQMPSGAVSSPCSSIGNGSQMWGPPPGHLDITSVRDTLNGCSRGALMVLDSSMAVLSRTWTLYEAWAATYYTAPGVGEGAQHLQVVLALDVAPESLLTFHNACSRIDLARAECTRPEDKQKIVGEVKSSMGIKRMQVSLGKIFLTGLRGYLRWSGDLEDLAMFCVLLMQAGDWAQLQYLLHSLPGLVDDEDTLNEIRDIFAMYDSDGTGELEEEEFAAVLATAGFAAEEASRIFHEVDADGGGSVGLDEFETWWIESQRQQAREMRPTVVLTQGGLVQNLQLLAALLERREMPAAAALIQQHATSIQTSGIQGVKGEAAPLPPYTPKGDYLHVADQVVFKILAKELKPALKMMLDLLAVNLDALALDAPPSAALPSPSSVSSMCMPIARAALAWTMALVAELLGRNPGRLREAMHFAGEAAELANQGTIEKEAGGVLGSVIRTHKQSNRRNSKSQNKVQEAKARDSIVTSMVRLKYGSNSLISHRLIAEASISLSTWMASNKQNSNQKVPKGRDSSNGSRVANKKGPSTSAAAAASADGVNDFASAYLNSNHKGSRELKGVSDNGKLPLSLPDLCRQLETSYQVTVEHYAEEAAAAAAAAAAANEMDFCLSTWPGTGPPADDDDTPLRTSVSVRSPNPLAPAMPSPDPTVPLGPSRSHGDKRAASSVGMSKAAAHGQAPAAPDDAGIEHLTHFARAVRTWDPTDRAVTASPLDQLGSRLEKVRDKQRGQGMHVVRSPSPYGMGYFMTGLMGGTSSTSASPHPDAQHLPPVMNARSRQPSSSGAAGSDQRRYSPGPTAMAVLGQGRQTPLSRVCSQQEAAALSRVHSHTSNARFKRTVSPRRSGGGSNPILPATRPGLSAATDPLAERLASLHLPVLSPKSNS